MSVCQIKWLNYNNDCQLWKTWFANTKKCTIIFMHTLVENFCFYSIVFILYSCFSFYSCSRIAASIVTKRNIALLTTELLNNSHVFNSSDFWEVSTQKVSACYAHIWLGSIFLSCWVIDGFLVHFIRHT